LCRVWVRPLIFPRLSVSAKLVAAAIYWNPFFPRNSAILQFSVYSVRENFPAALLPHHPVTSLIPFSGPPPPLVPARIRRQAFSVYITFEPWFFLRRFWIFLPSSSRSSPPSIFFRGFPPPLPSYHPPPRFFFFFLFDPLPLFMKQPVLDAAR